MEHCAHPAAPWFVQFLSLCVCQHPDIVNIFAVVEISLVLTRRPICRLTDYRRSVIIPCILSGMTMMLETSYLRSDMGYA